VNSGWLKKKNAIQGRGRKREQGRYAGGAIGGRQDKGTRHAKKK
jgi:hypothetical protein